MWLKFKWDMFVTSFIPLWISIIIFDLWDIVENAGNSFSKKGKLSDIFLGFLRVNILQLLEKATPLRFRFPPQTPLSTS